MKCSNCGNEFPSYVIARVLDKNGENMYCANCLCMKATYGLLETELENNNDYICDITNKNGAILYISDNEKYALEKELFIRLIKRALKPHECLLLLEKYSADAYLLHDDFYDPATGEAIQPLD